MNRIPIVQEYPAKAGFATRQLKLNYNTKLGSKKVLQQLTTFFMNKILLIARREFLSRVQKKTFLLTTIGLPLLIFVFYALIIYFSVKATDNFTIAVADEKPMYLMAN